MKKKNWVISLVAAVAVIATPAAALASGVEQPVRIIVKDGEPVQFEQEPFIVEGHTFVQFRPIFEKLGLTVGWDEASRTVSGSGDGVEVMMQIGSTEAAVNGAAVKLEVAPQIVEGSTYVPVRFVAEAAGRQVGWDASGRAVIIGTLEDQAAYVLGRSFEQYNSKNLKGFLAYYNNKDPQYALLEKGIGQELALYNMDIRFDGHVNLLQQSDDSITVQYTKNITDRSGTVIPGRKMTNAVPLKLVNGEWKLGIQEVPLKLEFQLAEEKLKDDAPVVSEADHKAVLDALEHYRAAIEKEDSEELRQSFDASFAGLETVILQYAQMGALADWKVSAQDARILRFGGDEAAVRYELTFQKTGGSKQIPSYTADVLSIWKKNSDGKWKLMEETSLSIEYDYE